MYTVMYEGKADTYDSEAGLHRTSPGKLLKAQASLRSITEAEVIREAIDLLDRYSAGLVRISAEDGWDTYRKLITEIKPAPGTEAYVWKRDDAYGPRAGFEGDV